MPKPSSANVVSSHAVENLEDRRLMTASYDIGINVNDTSAASVAKVVPILKDLGVKTVRIWSSVTDFSTNRTMTNAMLRAIDYSAAGFNVTLEVANKGGFVTDPEAVKGYLQWAVSNPALKAAVDQWEIGNEPDHDEYWNGTLQEYVNNFLKPAYEVLSAANEDVISAGPSWNVKDVATMIDAGMLNYTDYVGFHPYATGVAGVKKSISDINTLVAGRKPIAATEWNVRGFENDKTAWAKAVEQAFPTVRDGLDLSYYFALKVQNSLAGPGGILTTALNLNQPFYNAVATFKNAGSGTDTPTPPTPPTTPTNPDTGNTPDSSGATISGTLFNDTDRDGKLDAAEKKTGSRVVYIDANGNGRYDSGEKTTTSDAGGKYAFSNLAKGTYKISRVFPNGYRLTNNNLGYVSVTVAYGQQVSGVNLGTHTVVVPTTPTTPTPPTTPTNPTTPTPPTTPTNPTPPTNPGSGSTVTAQITSLKLVDADTDKVIAGYESVKKDATIKLDSIAADTIAVVANINANVGSIRFTTTLAKPFVENNAPFAATGDKDGDLLGFDATAGKTVRVVGTAFTADDAKGTQGNTFGVNLTFA